MRSTLCMVSCFWLFTDTFSCYCRDTILYHKDTMSVGSEKYIYLVHVICLLSTWMIEGMYDAKSCYLFTLSNLMDCPILYDTY